ncbi:hypothetical protein GCM10008956_02910 [Deinococcus arenae]|uniref:Lipoprotein n=1 Tax=Deinococcus arenae TaxID=1452751 RepID=A0A8H9GI77_9DEIO|nr:hypothetical protein [Deinococcus arenae]GGM30295.1 hypothetical protein GCM10008956_02910 [Deinococcus arenae]
MKKLMLAAVGLTGLLAGCGSFGGAPDGSGNARVVGISTEYQLAGTGQFVGCDAVTNPTDITRATSTQVVVTFAAAGSISTVDVALKGTSSSQYDESQSFNVSQLGRDASGNYQVVFDFKSASGDFLPASIIVNPTPPAIRSPRSVTATDAAGPSMPTCASTRRPARPSRSPAPTWEAAPGRSTCIAAVPSAARRSP